MKRTTPGLATLLALAVACGGGSTSSDSDSSNSLIKSGTLPTDAQLCSLVSADGYGSTTGQQVLAVIGGSDANVARDAQGNIVNIYYSYTEHEPGQAPSVDAPTGFSFDSTTHYLTCVGGRTGVGSSAHPLPSCLPNTSC